MKKILLVLILSLIPSLAWARSFTDYTVQQIGQCENFKGGQATASSTASSITVTSIDRDTKAVHLYNSGTVDVYYDPTGTVAVADTSHAVLRAGRDVALGGFKSRTISIITASSTSTIDYEACY